MVNELTPLAASPPFSPPAGTTVAVSGTFLINGTLVTVNSGDITKLKQNGISFTLSQPVTLGTIDNFIDWLHDQLGLPITSEQVDGAVNQIPQTPKILDDIRGALLSLLHGEITLTSLTIDTARGYYAFGVTMDLNPPISVLGLLQFEGLGLQFSHTSLSASPPKSP